MPHPLAAGAARGRVHRLPPPLARFSLHADFDALRAAVDRHPIVCFDVFGTLLLRGFEPAPMLHAWLETKLCRIDGRYAQFRWMRPRAERVPGCGRKPSGQIDSGWRGSSPSGGRMCVDSARVPLTERCVSR